MSGHWGILVSDPCLQNQFTQVELRSLKSHVSSFLDMPENVEIESCVLLFLEKIGFLMLLLKLDFWVM